MATEFVNATKTSEIPAGGVTALIHRRLYERTAEPASDAGG